MAEFSGCPPPLPPPPLPPPPPTSPPHGSRVLSLSSLVFGDQCFGTAMKRERYCVNFPLTVAWKDSCLEGSVSLSRLNFSRLLVCFLVFFSLTLLFFCLRSPAFPLGFTILGEIFAYVTVFNPTIEVATLRRHGWYMLGVFLLPAFTRLGHECQDRLSP